MSNKPAQQGQPAISRAIDALGGVAKLAAAVGVSDSLPSMWKARGAVPPQHCAQIEMATSGVVTRRDLRPLDWHLIWPELVTDEFQPPKTTAPPAGMSKSQALAWLGPRASDVARAIGVSPSAVSQWPDELPPRIADRVIAAMARRAKAAPAVDQIPPSTVADAA